MRRMGLCLAVWCGAACSGPRTGVLLEVAAGDGAPAPDRLVFFVATRESPAGHAAYWLRDPTSSVTVAVSGRDLTADPYRLLVTEGRRASAGAPILAAVLAYRVGDDAPVGFAALPPVHMVGGDVLLERMRLGSAGATLGATGCLSWSGGQIADEKDRDCDGYRGDGGGGPPDCDDLDPAVSPGASEVCGNGIDDDCDGAVDEIEDADSDGRNNCVDCDDHNRYVYPGAPELCDGLDNNCDGQCDEGLDADGDGLTPCGSHPGPGARCLVSLVGDCLDDDPTGGPGQPEICDGKDNDCNGKCDDLRAFDVDGDGYTSCGTLAGQPLPPGAGICGATAAKRIDCNDSDPSIHPFAHELCDGVDDDCDGRRLAAAPCYGAAGGGCAIGSAACDDDRADGSFGLAGCVVAAGAPAVPAALCAAYGGCADKPDPFRCADAAAARWVLDCDLAYRSLVGDPTQASHAELCPGAGTDLPAVSEVFGCSWQLLGGAQQERLRAGLSPRAGGAPQPELQSCTGRLVVTGFVDDLGAVPDELVVLYAAPAAATREVAVYRLTPRPVDACPAAPVSCKIVAP